ncbi:hypothetical protein ABW20_dc0107907 [Dactylellina cionopaga]|nr:hypothetical protein ABW20_dc0107907 [Dactylellina cionopaga]
MDANDSSALLLKSVTDELSYETSSPIPHKNLKGTDDTYLIVFFSGNPGLISFYEPFLSTLTELLGSEGGSDSSSTSNQHLPSIHVYGHSLQGFNQNDISGATIEEDEEPLLSSTSPSTLPSHNKIYEIQQIIQNSEDLLGVILRQDRYSQKRPKIILMGHSVGAYIALELIQRRNLKSECVDIVGCITLFPTIVDIAKSLSGRTIGRALRVPYIPWMLGAIVRLAVYFVHLTLLYKIIKLVTRFPDHATRSAAVFIKSITGVEQALTLGKDEMETIKEDKWTEKVFGAKAEFDSDITPSPKLVFFFGGKDSWVSNSIRDKFISQRGNAAPSTASAISGGPDGTPAQTKAFPKMIIDDSDIPHAFPIRHGEIVAEKVKIWVKEIIDADQAQVKAKANS